MESVRREEKENTAKTDSDVYPLCETHSYLDKIIYHFKNPTTSELKTWKTCFTKLLKSLHPSLATHQSKAPTDIAPHSGPGINLHDDL